MNEVEMLKRDIETLKESIRLEYAERAGKVMSGDEMAAFRVHIQSLQDDLNLLRERLDNLKAS